MADHFGYSVLGIVLTRVVIITVYQSRQGANYNTQPVCLFSICFEWACQDFQLLKANLGPL